jgi:molecular chaperone Hsp33
VVPLHDDGSEPLQKLSEVLEHYMLQSEQLDTKLILAADDHIAAGLLIQRLPIQGEGNLAGNTHREDDTGLSEHYNRIAHLATTLKREELLTLDVDTLLRRLFWEEDLRRFDPMKGSTGPRFACSCSRERVGNMLRSLGQEEAQSIIDEQGQIDVGCDFCGQHHQFDSVDVSEIFTDNASHPPGPTRLQ